MFALTGGELAIVLFIFALVWGAGALPRLGEHLGAWFARRTRLLPSGPQPLADRRPERSASSDDTPSESAPKHTRQDGG